MATRDNRNTRSRGDDRGTRSPQGSAGRSRGDDRGTRSPQGSVYSRGSGRSPRSPQESVYSRGSNTERKQRPKSANAATGRDRNQFALNSPAYSNGRLPNGRLVSGVAPEGMVHHPRAGSSRTQFGGMWEDHKLGDRPMQSGTRTGFSEFGDNEPHECSTYQNHLGTFFDGNDTMNHNKPNAVGVATAVRAVNGYGRTVNGGFCMREKLGDMKTYKHSEAWRGMPAWARKYPEPTRPGPGYSRTDQGGFFRT